MVGDSMRIPVIEVGEAIVVIPIRVADAGSSADETHCA